MASHPLEVTYGVTDGIHSHVAHVQAPRRVREHGEDVKLFLLRNLELIKKKKKKKNRNRGMSNGLKADFQSEPLYPSAFDGSAEQDARFIKSARRSRPSSEWEPVAGFCVTAAASETI